MEHEDPNLIVRCGRRSFAEDRLVPPYQVMFADDIYGLEKEWNKPMSLKERRTSVWQFAKLIQLLELVKDFFDVHGPRRLRNESLAHWLNGWLDQCRLVESYNFLRNPTWQTQSKMSSLHYSLFSVIKNILVQYELKENPRIKIRVQKYNEASQKSPHKFTDGM